MTHAAPTASRRKNLVILRAGDQSLHRGWIAGPERDFDLFISYYGQQPELHREDAEYYEMRRGPKWSCIADLIAEHAELVASYAAVWLPDDDLAADTATLNRLFSLFHGLQLGLAQPALTHDSYFTWAVLLQHPDYVLRHTEFVEVMAPLFSREALAICLPSFRESRSGWGLDWVWPKLLDRTRFPLAVIDATPVKHTRPLGGELYKNNPELSPHADEMRLVTQYQVQGARAVGKYGFVDGLGRKPAPWWDRLRLRVRRWNALRKLQRQQARHQSTRQQPH